MHLAADIRFAFRSFSRRPAHSAIIVVTLALGIGLTAAVFNLVDNVLLQPLPFLDGERLVVLTETADDAPADHDSVSAAAFLFWREQSRAFEGLAAYDSATLNLTGIDRPQTIQGVAVSPELFSLLRAEPLRGRAFSREDGEQGAAGVAVINYGLWQSVWGGAEDVVGKTLSLDGEQHLIVGVMPADFRFVLPGVSSARKPAVWTPLRWSAEDFSDRRYYYLNVIARLNPGVSLTQARQDAQSAYARFDEAVADPVADARRRAVVLPVKEQLLDIENLDATFSVASAAALCVLLIACINVISLLLSRAVERKKETAIRQALGAGRGRIAGPFLSESLTLALLSGLLGLATVDWTVRLLLSVSPIQVPRADSTGLDWRVAAFVLGLSLGVGLVNGLVALASSRGRDLRAQLAEAARLGSSQGGRGGRRLRTALVAGQVALAVMLSIGASLLAQSYLALRSSDPGFQTDNLLTAWIILPSENYPPPQRGTAFFSQLLQRLRRIPGVTAAGACNTLPLSGMKRGTSLELAFPLEPGAEEPWAAYRVATPGYFESMGISLLQGRDLGESDEEGSQRVAVINRTLADLYWPGRNPLGESVRIRAAGNQWHRVVGVVSPTLHRGLNSGYTPEVFVSYRQAPTGLLGISIRSEMDPGRLSERLREEVLTIDPDQPVYSVDAMNSVVAESVAVPRFRTLVMSFFSGLALFLALLGIYGILSYSVARRTHEMGIRMALGADGERLKQWVVGQGMRTALLGTALGLAAALALSRLLTGLLFQVSPYDPWTFLAVPAALLLAALAACYLPARRVTRVDPLTALRD